MTDPARSARVAPGSAINKMSLAQVPIISIPPPSNGNAPPRRRSLSGCKIKNISAFPARAGDFTLHACAVVARPVRVGRVIPPQLGSRRRDTPSLHGRWDDRSVIRKTAARPRIASMVRAISRAMCAMVCLAATRLRSSASSCSVQDDLRRSISWAPLK